MSRRPDVSEKIHRLTPLLALALSLTVTLLMTHYAQEGMHAQSKLKFENEAKKVKVLVQQRLDLYVDALHGLEGLFSASKSVEEDEWAAYVRKQDLKERFPGIVEMRFIERVKNEGQSDEAWVVKYVEPFDPRIIGADMRKDETRKQALKWAADLGKPAATKRLVRRLDEKKDPAFMIFIPIYQNGAEIQTVLQRQEALVGFAGEVINSKEFLNGILSTYGVDQGIHFEIFDGDALNSGFGRETLIYENLSSDGLLGGMSKTEVVEVGGRVWTLRFHAGTSFGLEDLQQTFPYYVLFGGAVFSLLIFGILYSLQRSNDRAVRYALQMTRDLRRSEESLRESKDYLAKIIDSIADPLFVKDRHHRYILLNSAFCQFMGGSREQLIDKSDFDLFPEQEAKHFSEQDAEVFKTGLENLNEEERTDGHGVKHITQTKKALYKDANGELFIVGVIRDVTDYKKLEAQFLQSQKMETIGTLAGGVAHDLNNQLTPLLGYLDLVLAGMPPEDANHRWLTEAGQSARRCSEVVQRLMNFSRPSSHRKKIMSVQHLLKEIWSLLPQLLPSTIETSLQGAGDLWPVQGNATELHTVLVNLVVNARDAMPHGGQIVVTAGNRELAADSVKKGFPAGPYVCLSVLDTGSGIPAEIAAHIFEPFFTTKKKEHGTGLGLSTAFNIVKDHGGWMDVESTPGRGTVFEIFIPAHPESKIGEEESSRSALSLRQGHGKVLFVDDEQDMRNLGKVLLERLGYEAILASDGEEAVKIYKNRQHEIVAIILDMTMPKLTGKQALKGILTVNPSARVILSSGYTSEGNPQDFIKEGAKFFVQKPYTVGLLAHALEKAIEHR